MQDLANGILFIHAAKFTVNFGEHRRFKKKRLHDQGPVTDYGVKICLVTSFRENGYIEILPKDIQPSRELWLSFWSEVHYNSLYEIGEVPARVRRKKHWLF
ncbi:hypothetical protein HAX54_028138 [Datura stramonium]|uniref:OTU domain-containing protein n=1 Tax=Datura stramonium TaxID=4076 RepID=A0ABS8S9G9_DATST|nr:hypothetical protein [Datura stramonium]